MEASGAAARDPGAGVREADIAAQPTPRGAVGRLDAGGPRSARARRIRRDDVRPQSDERQPGEHPWHRFGAGARDRLRRAAQLLAGLWEFRTGNTFGAVAFCSFGAFWISYFVLVRLIPAAAVTPHGVSAYLWMWAIFTIYMFFASLRTTGAVAVVFFLLAVTFVLLAWGDMGSGHTSIHKAGGWVGLATAIAAWYASFAAVMNSTWGRVVLPVYPLKKT